MDDRVDIYGPSSGQARGNNVAFNIYGSQDLLPFEEIEAKARADGIALRGGCFCNPGAAERALDIPVDQSYSCFQKPEFTIAKFRECLGGGAAGALRASFGLANNLADVETVLDFLCEASTGTARTALLFTDHSRKSSFT